MSEEFENQEVEEETPATTESDVPEVAAQEGGEETPVTTESDTPELEVQEFYDETSVPAESDVPELELKPKKKGKGKIILIVVAAVLVVLVGGGAGVYFGTHDQPGFCNFICHTPMDPYVASYNDGTSILPIQAEAQAEAAQAGTPIVLSVTLHKESDQQLNCLDCHEPTMSEQITEGIKWISGDYSVPLAGFEVVPSTPREGQKAAEEFCLREGCHEGIASLEDLKKATADEHRNPHNSHNGDQACTKCHQTHEQSVMWCTQCHGDSTVPDGWLTYQEQQSQQKKAEEAAAAAGA